jgi:hypothetical protein
LVIRQQDVAELLVTLGHVGVTVAQGATQELQGVAGQPFRLARLALDQAQRGQGPEVERMAGRLLPEPLTADADGPLDQPRSFVQMADG